MHVHCVCIFFFALYSEMYLAAGELIKAIEIMGQNGWVERYMYILSTIPRPMHTHVHVHVHCMLLTIVES